MNLLELAKQRHSVRKFQDREVEQEKLEYILECARRAPSAVNFQPWKFFIVKSREKQEQLRQCYPSKWFVEAKCPYFIVACGDTEQSWKRKKYDGKDFTDVDISIAVEHICLAATEQGLGTCWVCAFDPEKLKQVLQLPESMYPLVILPLGYPDEEKVPATPRKEIDEITETI